MLSEGVEEGLDECALFLWLPCSKRASDAAREVAGEHFRRLGLVEGPVRCLKIDKLRDCAFDIRVDELLIAARRERRNRRPATTRH